MELHNSIFLHTQKDMCRQACAYYAQKYSYTPIIISQSFQNVYLKSNINAHKQPAIRS